MCPKRLLAGPRKPSRFPGPAGTAYAAARALFVPGRGGGLPVLFLVFALLAAGCSPEGRNEVSGQVAVDGQPVETGSISFVPVEGGQGPQAGGNISKGSYHLARKDGPFAGRHRVEIIALRPTGKLTARDMGGRPMDPMENITPKKYQGPKSELVVDIKNERNVLNFELKK